MELKNIVYSNSDYFDVLEIFLEEQEKHGINIKDIIIFSNKPYLNYKCIIYNNLDSYSSRLINCLSAIKDEIILFQHEDMFLYSSPNFKILKNYFLLLKNSEYSFVRLCRTGFCILNKTSIDSLFDIDKSSNDFFAVQPTIWKVKDLIHFLSNAKDHSIWDLELKSSTIARKSNICGLMHFDNEPPRGGHFDSYVWPYVATAIVKGKWNFIQYSNELNKIEKILKNNREKL